MKDGCDGGGFITAWAQPWKESVSLETCQQKPPKMKCTEKIDMIFLKGEGS